MRLWEFRLRFFLWGVIVFLINIVLIVFGWRLFESVVGCFFVIDCVIFKFGLLFDDVILDGIFVRWK